MSDLAIRLDSIGKQYRIGRQRGYRTFRETVNGFFTAPVGTGPRAGEQERTIWALRDISLDVKQGQILGVIGRNGSGKSTLLKVLARITEPTEGTAEVHGRVGTLLEVGTGFHPELTGRENVFLSGAILGMRKSEVLRSFDEIIAFAGVEEFVDTPVKHYSSGMYLRLAFAVAAHLLSDILFVDEVLAVGDASFQKKCLGKIDEVARAGRTILFVSHNMEAVQILCDACVVLDHGRVTHQGSPGSAVAAYLKPEGRPLPHEEHVLFEDAFAGGAQIVRLEVVDQAGIPKASISTWDAVTLRVHYQSERSVQDGSLVLDVRDFRDQRLLVLDSGSRVALRKGVHVIDCEIPRLPLAAGEYVLGAGLALSRSAWIWRSTNLATLRVGPRDVFELGRPPSQERMLFAVEHNWRESEV